ncbi:MAG TPA: hypothetical protein VG838_09635 [Opitutaceae bacterium]|nr:hypothetical protein [Opitutaceae bacterium]
MRSTARLSPLTMDLPANPSIGPRRYFPAWIDSDSGVPALNARGPAVLPRVRAALPLRQVFVAALSLTLSRKTSDARRMR